MSYTNETAGRQYVTAFFDTRSDAENAINQMVSAGISRSDIQIVEGSDPSVTTTAGDPDRNNGFFEALGDFYMPDEDRYFYAEGLRRGGYLLSVVTTPAIYDRVRDILESEGAVNMDEREEIWRSEGWSGYQGATAGTTAGYATREGSDREDYIPVAEEQVRVGKRMVDQGRVRVRSYVVETPVEERVNLRDETIDIDRRTVDRPATAADHLFEERVIEAEEHDEEAVVTKEARVTGEVRLNKSVEEREQVVSDTVRRTEVEVEDERTSDARLTDAERARRDRNL